MNYRKSIIIFLFSIFAIVGCSNNSEEQNVFQVDVRTTDTQLFSNKAIKVNVIITNMTENEYNISHFPQIARFKIEDQNQNVVFDNINDPIPASGINTNLIRNQAYIYEIPTDITINEPGEYTINGFVEFIASKNQRENNYKFDIATPLHIK